MPALVSSSSQSTANIPQGSKNPSSRPKRLVRRRGRGRDELSDDEVEREALSDSDFSSGSTDSATRSDDDEDITRSTLNPGEQKSRSIRSSAPSPPAALARLNGHKPFTDTSANWSEMVTAEQDAGGGSSSLPIIHFDEFTPGALNNTSSALHSSEEVTELRTKASKRKGKKLARVDERDASVNEPAASAPRPPKPNPRQAYLDRLSSDPSYVPRVGAFWSHDERLMDKDLRSMSGWWRGRWQGRGRGRSDLAVPGRGRGRGTFRSPAGGSSLRPATKDVKGSSTTTPPAAPATNGNQSWTHDGYAELDESDRMHVQDRANPLDDSSGRARGGLSGRDAFTSGALPPPASFSVTSDPSPPTPQSPIGARPQPPRFGKAERPWTKPLDTSLLGHHPKAKMSGQGLNVRVQLPVKMTPTRPRATLLDRALGRAISPQTDHFEAFSDDGDRAAIVRLPGRPQGSSSSRPRHFASPPDSIDLQTVNQAVPDSPSPEKVKLPSKASGTVVSPSSPHIDVPAPLVTPAPVEPEEELAPELPHFDGIQDVGSFAIQETESVPSQSPNELDTVEEKDPFVVQVPPNLERPTELLRQAFAPQSQQSTYHPSPARPLPYNNVSEYSPYPAPPPLPAGLAVGENGMFYEVATGRMVVLTPPPAPLFNPRAPPYFPTISHPYPIHHSHTHPLTPDFITPPAGTPPGVHSGRYAYSGRDSPRYAAYSPIEGRDEAPIFVPARQTSGALEIRAPANASVESSSDGSPSTSNGERRPQTPTSGSGAILGPKGVVKAPFRPSGLRFPVNAEAHSESLTSGTPPAPYVMTQPHYVQTYPGSPYYPVPDYAGYSHAYGADPQYGYYGQSSETSYGYPVPPQHDGSVEYSYVSYQGAPYAQDAPAQGMYY